MSVGPDHHGVPTDPIIIILGACAIFSLFAELL
jgi:hypothetical protein